MTDTNELDLKIVRAELFKLLSEGLSYSVSLSKLNIKKNYKCRNFFDDPEILRLRKLYAEGYFKK